MNECAISICPDLRTYWKLSQVKGSDQIILQAIQGNHRFVFSSAEGYALRYFTGEFTVEQVQQCCQQQFSGEISPHLVTELLEKLIALGILASDIEAEGSNQSEKLAHPKPNTPPSPQLKPCVQWVRHTDGYWILRNPEDVSYLQVSDCDKAIIAQLGELPLDAIAQEFCITKEQLRYLIQLLAATGMLVGTKPAKKQRRGKFTPLQLLSFKISLFNPDPWLTRNIKLLHWIWTPFFGFILFFFLAFSAAIGISQKAEIIHKGQQLWHHQGASLIIPFALLTVLVVSIHELGHAFTLKHFGGIVPEFGLLFMALIPAAYTNTTDSYCLARWKRVLVVGAGVLTQFIMAAIALWLWNATASGTWLHNTSYLLMVASLVTVALNLNPLSKFDGYYLFVALTGINNLRSRSFSFYGKLLSGKPIREKASDSVILAAYAPFSFAYIYFVFGFLLFEVTDWSLTNIPTIAIILLTLWAIYFYFPNPQSKTQNLKSKIDMTANNPSNSPNRPNLKVVPPTSEPKLPAVAPNRSTPETVTPPKSNGSFPFVPLLTLTAILVGLGLVSQIEVPHSVPGEVVVDSTPKARQSVYMQIPGTIKRILVEQNQPVKYGQPIAELDSDELEKEIEEAQIKLAEAKLAVASARENLESLRSTLNKAAIEEEAVRQTSARQQEEITEMNRGNLPPRISILSSQIEGIRRDIAGLQGNLAIQDGRISKIEPLVKEGALSKFKLDDLQIERNNLLNQIQSKQNQINPLLNQIADVKLNMQKELAQYQAELMQKQAATAEVSSRIKQAAAEVKNRQQLVEQLQGDLQRVKDKRKYLILTADTTGIAIKDDLDKLQNKKMSAGEVVLDIVDVEQLTAKVQIAQEDKPLVKTGASVKFYPRDPQLNPYTAKVERIDQVVKVDPAGKPMVNVYISLKNDDLRLKPGETGYAQIEAESMQIGERVYREIRKLFPRGKWQAG